MCLAAKHQLTSVGRFESIIKPESFYSEHASGKTRRYFYNVDMNGRLFLGTFYLYI
jgi:hypothetical protein